MRTYKIILFGELPFATKVAMSLKNNKNIEIVGVVTGISDGMRPKSRDPWTDILFLDQYAKLNNIPIFKHEELTGIFERSELDLGVLCRYGKILKKDTIELFSKGVINCHGGLLPEFAGLNSANFSILMNSKIGGGTIHFVDEGIDTGDVIRRCEFPISEDDTAFTVFQKTQEVLYNNLIEIIPMVLSGSVKTTSMNALINQGHESNYYNKNCIEGFKEIRIDELNSEEAIIKIRAFDFPDHEPAFVMINGKKVYLRTGI